MDKIKLSSNDLLFAAAALSVILIIAVFVVVAILVLFTIGSPFVLFSTILGFGVFGIFALIGLAIATISFWYVIYAFIKNYFDGNDDIKSTKNYSINRIKKS
ncbi:MAG: hypothetical protein ABH842_01095 [Candidatus Micrarchaeota archaeon]